MTNYAQELLMNQVTKSLESQREEISKLKEEEARLYKLALEAKEKNEKLIALNTHMVLTLLRIRDSTHRDALSLRAMAHDCLVRREA